MFEIFQTLFPKTCSGCSRKLEVNGPLVCETCTDYLSVVLRFECAVCSRDSFPCQLCHNPKNIERILATFEKTSQVEKTLERAKFLSGWRLHEAIANAMWIRFLSSGVDDFQEVIAAASFADLSFMKWIQGWKRVPLNQAFGKAIAKQMKASYVSQIGWRLRRFFQTKSQTGRLLVVAASLSEREMVALAKKFEKIDPTLRLTFLIGCWK